MMRFFSLVLLVLVGCTGGMTEKKGRHREARESVVKRADLIQKVTIAGNVVPNRFSLINSAYSGYVRKLYVSVGDKVQSGAPLVSVSQSLQSNDTVYPIRAPFAGVVSQVAKLEGEFVNQSDANSYILRVDDFSKMFIDASVPEADRSKLQVGQSAVARATALGEKTYNAVIREIAYSAKVQNNYSSTQVLYPLKLEIVGNDASLVSGLSVLVDVETAKRTNVLQVGVEFVEKRNGKYFVTLVTGEKREIKVGIQNDEMVEIIDGLKEGDRLRQVDFAALGGSEE
jgi:multidrug efflux pump subunit AcrA (membrane-fusion protein)